MAKTILITGTSSGIGKATALYFAQQNWNVVATMRDTEKGTDFASFPNVLVTNLEVTDPKTIEDAIQTGIEKFGQIDAIVNNAGYGQQGLFEATTSEKIKAQFDVNVFGVMNVTRAILPYFRSRKDGTIITVSSISGRVSSPFLSIYSASKFAVEGFTESLAYELESQNIKVKLVEPGYIETPFYDRTNAEFAFNPKLTDYKEFNEEMSSFYVNAKSNLAFTTEDVANLIFTAATDDNYQLRYVAGPDMQPMIDARNHNEDQDYVDFMRNIFRPNSFKN